MLRFLGGVLMILVFFFVMGVVVLFFWLCLLLEIDLVILVGDGSLLDYCLFVELDGSGKVVVDIFKGNMFGCSYIYFLLLILVDCIELFGEGVDDIWGFWCVVEGSCCFGYVECIE